MRLLKSPALLLLLYLMVAGQSSADTFTFSPLPFFGGTGLNNTGQIVGTRFGAETGFQGFLYQDGNLTSFQIPGSNSFSTRANGINDAGVMVGWYNDQKGAHGYSGTLDPFTTIDVPGQTNTKALGINNAGAITGTYVDASGSQQAFLYNGAFRTIVPDLGNQTTPNAINDSGAIVGYFTDNTGLQHGFLLSASGAVAVIDVPGSIATAAYGINDAGMIVGSFATNTNGIFQTHGFLDIDGIFATIDAPDASLLRFTSALAINNEDQILLNGSSRSYLATFTAVPEPGSAVLFAAGVITLAIFSFRRRAWARLWRRGPCQYGRA